MGLQTNGTVEAVFVLLAVLLFSVSAISAEQQMEGGSSRKVVTIYQFKSEVPEVSAASATDMFITALVKTRAFAVLERQRLEESVYLEKQLNQQGATTGGAGDVQLTGADYIFVGTITEANATKKRSGIAGTFKGLGVESSGTVAEIGIDVRVLDARTGAVLDAVSARKEIKEGGMSISGVGSFLRSVTGRALPGGDVNLARERKEGVDRALREVIEEAVNILAQRWGR